MQRKKITGIFGEQSYQLISYLVKHIDHIMLFVLFMCLEGQIEKKLRCCLDMFDTEAVSEIRSVLYLTHSMMSLCL